MSRVGHRGVTSRDASRRGASSRGASYRAALAVPEFRAIFAAVAVAISGSVISAVALTVLVYARTRSPLLSALTFAVGFIPYAFGGTLLSGVVDRVPARRLLVSCYLGSAGLTAAMAVPPMPVAALLALLIGIGTLNSISGGVIGGLVRSSVPRASYVPARSLLRVAAQLAQVAGYAFGGLLVAAVTPPGAIGVNSAAFVSSAVLARYGLRHRAVPARGDDPPEPPAVPAGVAAGTSLLGDSLRGVRQILADASVRRLLLLGWLVPTFWVWPEALAAPYVAARGGSPAVVGWWLVALPVGMITGDLLGVWGLGPGRQRRVVGLAAGASFLPYLAFLAEPPVAVAWPLLAVAGLGALYSLGLDALVRDAVPARMFARTMAISSAGLMTLQGLGFALAGAVAQAVGPSRAIAVAGCCGLAVVAVLRPRDRTVGCDRERRPTDPALGS